MVCCGAVEALASNSSAACWRGGLTREFCCDVARGPSGFDLCWDHEFDFRRCCNVEELHLAPSANYLFGASCWTGLLSDVSASCCLGSGNRLCWDDTHQFDSCCLGAVPPLFASRNDPSARCLEEVGTVKVIPHLASCAAEHLLVEVSRTTKVLLSDSYADEPWFLRLLDRPREPPLPVRPAHFTHLGHLCVPKACSEETVGSWLTPMLAPWWLPHERVVRKPVPLNVTHVVLPPRLGFRRKQFSDHHGAWVTFSASKASEPFHMVVAERPRSVLLQSYAWWLLVACACPVVFAGVLEGLGLNVPFLQPLAPQHSVREALAAPGVPCFDVCRVLFTVFTLILHTQIYNEWRVDLWWVRCLFCNVNVSFTSLSIFLSLRQNSGAPVGCRCFVQHAVPRFLRTAPLLWFGVYLRSVLPQRERHLDLGRCLQPWTLLSTLFFLHEFMLLERSPCGVIDIFESLFHVELFIWLLCSLSGGWLGSCALMLWPLAVCLDGSDPQTGRFLSQVVGHKFAELLPPALATAAVHRGLRGRLKSRRWLWLAGVCHLTMWLLTYCEDASMLLRWRRTEFQANGNRSVLLRLWVHALNLPHIVALVIVLNLFDGSVPQKGGVLRPLLSLCSRLTPAVLGLHTIFFELVNDYGRSSFDGSVFSFFGESCANVVCCFFLAAPIYFSVQVPANVLAVNFKLLLGRSSGDQRDTK